MIVRQNFVISLSCDFHPYSPSTFIFFRGWNLRGFIVWIWPGTLRGPFGFIFGTPLRFVARQPLAPGAQNWHARVEKRRDAESRQGPPRWSFSDSFWCFFQLFWSKLRPKMEKVMINHRNFGICRRKDRQCVSRMLFRWCFLRFTRFPRPFSTTLSVVYPNIPGEISSDSRVTS